ncbi:hypothetical protein T06_1768 [Trichinella sp. T6]|nr:hypothetical protein T06_10290 [Trichinella sp. T6]KRX53626.1 hypothetical protein T06_1768 [Trichinella sp. T6]
MTTTKKFLGSAGSRSTSGTHCTILTYLERPIDHLLHPFSRIHIASLTVRSFSSGQHVLSSAIMAFKNSRPELPEPDLT